MTIKSKFDIRDYVWFQFEGRYQIGKIVGIDGWCPDKGFVYDICSRDGKNHFRGDLEIYATKEEVLDSVFTKCEYDMETGW